MVCRGFEGQRCDGDGAKKVKRSKGPAEERQRLSNNAADQGSSRDSVRGRHELESRGRVWEASEGILLTQRRRPPESFQALTFQDAPNSSLRLLNDVDGSR